MAAVQRYRWFVSDNERWTGLPYRPSDVVISTSPKCGTTWMQTLCAFLLLDTVHLDRPLAELSPWVDMQTHDLAATIARLEAQQPRRFLKTHTPFDGLPIEPGVTYVFVGRDPRDVALSWDHHMANMDLDALLA